MIGPYALDSIITGDAREQAQAQPAQAQRREAQGGARMTQRFDELAAQRDPLYAATRSRTPFLQALTADREAEDCRRIGGLSGVATIKERERDMWLHMLTVEALRNQGEPYYQEVQGQQSR